VICPLIEGFLASAREFLCQGESHANAVTESQVESQFESQIESQVKSQVMTQVDTALTGWTIWAQNVLDLGHFFIDTGEGNRIVLSQLARSERNI
jgi:hypothetical protein